MTPKPIEVILARQLASYLAMPTLIVDAVGTLVFFNGAAERVLGLRFGETGEVPAGEWAQLFTPTADSGVPMPPEGLPLWIAFAQRRPAHGRFWIRGADRRAPPVFAGGIARFDIDQLRRHWSPGARGMGLWALYANNAARPSCSTHASCSAPGRHAR